MFIVADKEDEAKKAINLFNEALNFAQEENYAKAEEKYNEARDEFINLDNQTSIFAFRCIANKYINKVKIEEDTGKKELDISDLKLKDLPYKKIIDAMFKEIKENEKRILKDNFNIRFFNRIFKRKDWSNFNTKFSVINYVTAILKEMETMLYNKGLEDESIECYVKYMQHRIDCIRYSQQLEREPFWNKWILCFHENFLRLFGALSRFGVGARRLFLSASLTTIIFGLIFAITKTVVLNIWSKEFVLKNIFAGCRACFYFSFVNLINVGSEVYVPYGFCGRLFECIESVLGFVLLGMVIAIITRKIR